MPKEVQDAVNNLDAAAENRMGPQTTREDRAAIYRALLGPPVEFQPASPSLTRTALLRLLDLVLTER
jgi:hypothetical protein